MLKLRRPLICLITLSTVVLTCSIHAQKVDNSTIEARIDAYKQDPRGPYKDIRWFCKDGSFRAPGETCPEPGGVQRARYKDEVITLADANHIFLGQILSTTDKQAFWDASHYNSRLKQYQLEKYLRSIDDGWILRRGQYYRGAYQAEDEEAWGIEFLQWLVGNDAHVRQKFFLVRQAVRDIPHGKNDAKTLSVRAVSKAISDAYPDFMNLRVKIHGQPEPTDLEAVIAFRENHWSKLNADLLKRFETLITDMRAVYAPVDLNALKRYTAELPTEAPVRQSLEAFIAHFQSGSHGSAFARACAEQMFEIRSQIASVATAKDRLALLDLSLALEELYFREAAQWSPNTLRDAMDKICYSGLAATGTGYIEEWEWEQVVTTLSVPRSESRSLAQLTAFVERARDVIEWGTGMVNGVYKDVVQLYSGFEPLAYGFYDDRIRSSVLLAMGETVGVMGDFLARKSKLNNRVLDVPNQSTFRGLNPGYALGELVVVEGDGDIEVDRTKIYVFHHPPADLKPVAGILTVTEGNMVSHVQLLARNLGIPNAVLSTQNMEWLKRHAGQRVFYAVSNRGTVNMKSEAEMSSQEKELFAVRQRSDERITVPIDKMELKNTTVINMRDVDASSSGKLCGPKAANLGQLKLMFPENVVEGLVLPFGVFRQHMDQRMPGQNGSYWEFLNRAFQEAGAMRAKGETEEVIENYTLGQLNTLREAIKKIDLLPAFVSDLEAGFQSAFGQKIGNVPVFLRSDTNMEDLKDFTGAGLNLTLFNVVDRDKILQGIKDVWASPYTERSFKWRQRYLLNPENVFPSILIIPSVDVEYSGVMITKGITTGDDRDLTIAFSRGAGGAVDGQAAEAYLLKHQGGAKLLSPAREPTYRRLPVAGGSKTEFATFEQPILNGQNLFDLRTLSSEVKQQMPQYSESAGPFDVELGFLENKIWLFQIRPFVENKNAVSSTYLESITPRIDGTQQVKLNTTIN